mmetsp:Transcript_24790/g.40367  ORF Transcript_24790/g.40367 Transcript_24790/m.40367 type:complete len:239 (+) Transcript_24790:102-818(+)
MTYYLYLHTLLLRFGYLISTFIYFSSALFIFIAIHPSERFPCTLPGFPSISQVLMTFLMLCNQVSCAMPSRMVSERRAIFIHKWTGAERDLAGGAHPSSLASDFTFGAEFAWLGTIFVLLRLGNAYGNVLVFFTVMETNLDQILLDAETIKCGVLHRPSSLPLPCFNDLIDFSVGSLSCNRHHMPNNSCGFLLLTHIALIRLLDPYEFFPQLIVCNNQFIDHSARRQNRLLKLLHEFV